MKEWGKTIIGVIFGIISYAVFYELVEVFGIGENTVIGNLVHILIPITLSITTIVLSLRIFIGGE